MSVVDRSVHEEGIRAIFDPRSVAIYGISERTSLRIAENMTVPGVPFYGINPTKTEACGVPCFPTIGDCPAVPEMVVMGVGRRPGEKLFFGDTAAALLEKSERSLLFVAS